MAKGEPLNRAEWAMLIIAGIIVVIGLTIGIWWSWWQDNPAYTAPIESPPPVPNAFDIYVAAGDGVRVPMSGDSASANAGDATSSPETLVATYAANLALLRTGFAEAYQAPRPDNGMKPWLGNFRRLARLLYLEASVRAQRGDWAGAVSSTLDGIELGEDAHRQGGITGLLIGATCAGIVRVDVDQRITHLTAAQSRAAARRLEAILASHVPTSETLRDQLLGVQMQLMLTFSSGNWAVRFSEMYDDASLMALLSVNKRMIFNDYTREMERMIATADRPYAEQQWTASPTALWTTKILVDYASAQDRAYEAMARNRLLLLRLALRAYQAEHHAYPSALSALVPGYLARIPTDPYTADASPGYRARDDGYLLYCVGPDGRDDGGAPLSDKRPNAGVTGDLVAGHSSRK